MAAAGITLLFYVGHLLLLLFLGTFSNTNTSVTDSLHNAQAFRRIQADQNDHLEQAGHVHVPAVVCALRHSLNTRITCHSLASLAFIINRITFQHRYLS